MSEPSSVPPGGGPLVVPRDQHSISRKNIADEALKTLYRLNSSGHKAYLVGGAVRDLLLGKRPSDFDVGTDATPEQIRRLFRNSRIIGRRFRIVQVLFHGRKVVEVATFRREPDFAAAEEEHMRATPPPDVAEDDVEALAMPPDDGSAAATAEVSSAAAAPSAAVPAGRRGARQDEHYGSAEDDARRRDITINGLFYDVKDFTVIDYVGGLADLRDGIVRFIGDPETKVREDTVRIIRALRHAGRTGFAIEPASATVIEAQAAQLAKANPSRIAAELQRDLKSGHAGAVFRLLRRHGVLGALVPELASLADSTLEGLLLSLERLDAAIARGTVPDNAVVAAVLLWPLAERVVMDPHAKGDPGHAVHQLLLPVYRRIGVARRDGAVVELLYLLLRRVWTAETERDIPPSLTRRPQWTQLRLLYTLLKGSELPGPAPRDTSAATPIPSGPAELGLAEAASEAPVGGNGHPAPRPTSAVPSESRRAPRESRGPRRDEVRSHVAERRGEIVAPAAAPRRGRLEGFSKGAGAEPLGF